MKIELLRTYAGTVISLLLNTTLSSAQEGYIKGSVRGNNEVVPDATVTIGTTSTFSDNNGEFFISSAPGVYMLTLSHSGYKMLEKTVAIQPGTTLFIDIELIPLNTLEEVFITGSRSLNRKTNLTAPVPVDVYAGRDLIETGQISLTQMLNFLAPSFNASREVLNEPSTLRGLDPQHVLILVNGIRYHSMAWLFSGGLRGQLGKGSVGNDLNSIPFPAIEKIEVLRDGAAAQYGSDAIAGVINIILKKSGRTTIQTHTGQFYEQDGEKYSIGVYHGLSLKNRINKRNGFISFSGAYRNQAPTFRGGAYEGLVYLNYPGNASGSDSLSIQLQDEQIVQSRGFNRSVIIDNAGNTRLNNIGLTINGGYPVGKRSEIVWTTLLNSRKLDRGGLFIFPRDSIRVNHFLYPDGYQQRNISHTVDASFTTGITGKSKTGWHWQLICAYGINSVKSHSSNTNNPSQTYLLMKNAPTSFHTGTDKFSQLANDLNVSKQIKEVNFSLGTEWRLEKYQTIAGEMSSWYNFDTARYSMGGPGNGPANEVNKNRNIAGTYVEIEGEISNRLLLIGAGRFEYYSDFGGNLAGKFAARYKFTGNTQLHVSLNNGFRAPSLQQRYLVSIREIWTGPTRSITVQGTFPNNHKVVNALNIPPLSAEKSININAGLATSFLKRLTFSIDAYWIQIKNRIVLSGNFERRNGNTLDSILDVYPELSNINRVSFFTNAIQTRTKGIDMVLNGNWSISRRNIGFSLAANFSSTRLFGSIKTTDKLETIAQSATILFNNEDRTKVEKSQPGSKIVLSVFYKTGGYKLNIRSTRFGETMIAPLSASPEYFSAKILTDLSLSFSMKAWYTIVLGANNITNVYPDRLKDYNNTGQGSWIYSPEASPFGFNGGYYYLSLRFELPFKHKTVQ